jgi:uncharacterized protein with HEPN domain
MPQRDPGVYLEDIEHYADAAMRFVATYNLEQYLADEKTRAEQLPRCMPGSLHSNLIGGYRQ